IAWIVRTLGGLAPVGLVFHVRRKTIRSRVERRLERLTWGCVSRFSVRTDIRDCVHGGTKSRARAFSQWLETVIAKPQQSSAGSIPANRQPITQLHQRLKPNRRRRPAGFPTLVAAKNGRCITRVGAPGRA